MKREKNARARKNYRQWEADFLRLVWPDLDYTIKELAAHLGRSLDGVNARAKRMGLGYRRRQRPPSPAEIEERYREIARRRLGAGAV